MATPVRQPALAKRPESVTRPAPIPPPEPRTKLPFEQKDVKYDAFPIVSEFSRRDMDRAKELMQDCAVLSEQVSEMEAMLKANRAELAEIGKRNNVPGGMRWGQLVCYVTVGQTRRSFKVEKAAEYMSLADIEACYEESKPTDIVKVVDLSKPKGRAKEESK